MSLDHVSVHPIFNIRAMKMNSFMRKRAKHIAFVLAFLIAVNFLYTSFAATYYPPADDAKPLAPGSDAARLVNAAIDDLEKTRLSGDTIDFHEKGDRVAKLADAVTLLQSHGITNHERFEAAIRQEFPWWTTASLQNVFAKVSDESGMVICVGSKNIQMAGHLILSLRNVLGYNQPIQVAYAGDEDLSTKDQAAVVKLSTGVELLDLFVHFNESIAGLKDGKYAMKPFAIIASRFRKTVLVDADVIFLKNPDAIFEEHAEAAKTGALFYHDRAYKSQGNSRKPWIQSLLGTRGPSQKLQDSLFWKEDLWQEMESGVVAFDRSHPRTMPTLLFTTWMNTKFIREKETYKHVLGDKETYWLAAELSNTPYYFQPSYAGLIGTLEPGTEDKICSAHILHMDASGETPFWFNGGLLMNKALDGRKFASLTDFVTGGRTMGEQPGWRYNGDEYWCAEGKTAVALGARNVDGVIERIFKEAGNVEVTFAM